MKAVAMVMPKVLNSPLRIWLNERAMQKGIVIEWRDISKDASFYCDTIKNEDNVIVWNCRVPSEWMRKHGRNVLYIENSLIDQSAGIFVDHGGFFSHSRLCRDQTWNDGHRYSLEWFAKKRFGWTLRTPGNLNGPILVALQNRQDCNINLEFPAAKDASDKVVFCLQLLAEHLPREVPVLIRPHPSERSKFETGGVWRDEWQIDQTGSFAGRLLECRALVTVNSTCASEATLTGMPVATLGTGAFTGSGATWECAHDPARLTAMMDQPINETARAAYASAVLARHFLPYDLQQDRFCREFEDWLTACQ